MPETTDAELRELAEAVAAVTPCLCSAQRDRAEKAEAEVARLRAGLKALAADLVYASCPTHLVDRAHDLAGESL